MSTLRGAVRIVTGVAGLAWGVLAACSSSTGTGSGAGIDGFCSAAARAPGCDDAQTCRSRFQQGIAANPPACEAVYVQFAECMSRLRIACTNGSDFFINVTGDGTPPKDFVWAMPIYVYNVKDAACGAVGETLMACNRCGDAVGYPGGRGIGDRCSGSETCTSGLTCRFGMCSRSCSSPDDCKGTQADRDKCQNEFNLDNVCVNGMCTGASDVANNFCTAYGSGWAPAGGGAYCAHP